MLKYDEPMSKEDLYYFSNLDLDDKIKLSKDIIVEFYESCDLNDGHIYISSSFGKDSIVLISLVRSIYPNVPIVYINTGVEQPSTYAISKEYENVFELTPKKSMEQVIEEYGYILPIGKDKSGCIEYARKNIYEGNFNTNRVKKLRGDYGKGLYDWRKLQPLLLAPFKISDRCCYWLKEQPLNSFTSKNKFKYQINGITAEESLVRKTSLLKKGFINKKECRPLGHWKVHDILEYILKYNLPLASCYGNIVEDENGFYVTTGFYRTGCTCCPVGSHRDKPNQFQLLYEIDIEIWDYVINDLGFKQVLDYFDVPYYPDQQEEHKNLDSFLE